MTKLVILPLNPSMTKLVNRIYLTLSGDAELIMSSIKEFIRQSKRENTHRGYIGWNGFDNVCHDMLIVHICPNIQTAQPVMRKL